MNQGQATRVQPLNLSVSPAGQAGRVFVTPGMHFTKA